MTVVLYVTGALVAMVLALVLTWLFCNPRSRIGGIWATLLIFTPYVFLTMIRIRCVLDPSSHCGWMSFEPGITWHIVPAVLLTLFAALIVQSLGLMASVRPMVGGWLALAWYSLPVWLIHVPDMGGSCPDVPIVCHDVSAFRLGGLFYWLLPFVAWTVVRVLRTLIRSKTQVAPSEA